MRTKMVRASQLSTRHALVENGKAIKLAEIQRSGGRIIEVIEAGSWNRRTFDVRDRVLTTDATKLP